jgi:predicted ATPase
LTGSRTTTPDNDRLFVITGGPSAGKSTLIEALAQTGLAVSHEAGRQIIKEQVAAGGRALPWTDRLRFAAAMLERDIANHDTWRLHAEPVFFDRGIPDVLGYLHLEGLPTPQTMKDAAQERRYNRMVFIAPPWPEIFTQDRERRQTPEESERTYHAMVRIYSECGYVLTDLPRVSVEERMRFVIERAGAL